MNRRRKRKRHALRWAILLLLVVAFVGFVAFAVLSERRRVETLAAIEPPPELRFHHQLAEAIGRHEDMPQAPVPPELQPALDTIASWKALFQRKRDEVNGEEWDAILDRWYEADGWNNLTQSDIDRIGAFLDKHGGFLTTLRETAALGGPMEVVPSYPKQLDMEHLRQARDCARLLRLNAIYSAKSGDTADALANLLAGFQISQALATEPSLMPQLVRFACAMMTQHALMESFPAQTFPDHAVAQLLDVIQQDPGRAPMVVALEEQRVSVVESLDAMLKLGWGARYAQMERNLFLSPSPLVRRVGKLAYASPLARPWFNRDIGALSESASEIAQISRLPYYEANRQYTVSDSRLRPYTHQQATATFMVLGSQARHEALLQLLQLGLTLEQYPSPPASLDALAGEFSEEVLTDPFTGQRFVYQPVGDSFLLYSVGENLTDDGGRHDFNDGDIVWRSMW